MTGLLQFVASVPKDQIQAYLVVPREPNAYQHSVLKKYFAEIAVVPMDGGWVRPSSHLSDLYKLRSILGGFLYSGFYLRTIYIFRNLISRWKIDKVYSGSLMILGAAVAAKVLSVPHFWHIKETFGANGNTNMLYSEFATAKIISQLSTTVIVMSDYIATPFRKYCLNDNIEYVPDGLDLSEYEGDLRGTELRRELQILPEKQVVGLVASLSARWKRHDLFIKAAHLIRTEYPDVQFVHFGQIPQLSGQKAAYFLELNNLVHSLGVSSDFTWAGPARNIPQMMGAMDILVHPCPTEPFGRVAIEAMAAQKPVVGPQSGGIAESVVHGETGLLSLPESGEALGEHVLTLLSDQELQQRMGRNGYARVRSKFSIEDHVARMRALML